ncbi:CDP-diacylglycerol--glycerol-3-phosphate 3-phosphatidyltransferase [Abiotrophia sp.]|uniref:CDP-diacylglycerol--glycerol-3-phosphate 3-phosphatidyltransferase n=1 Tax=Abiotrophia sp. TaxID=76631 RepID=UPI001CAC5BF6|nr:CDP-diacylglycerol--glycerol-3-phosphate 3-phosphatidyltransferase [Abiotrophia sp.]MBF0942174.1 CDP-diacylglycerol--glycerol-3-phosphate 3-phosphatidyltransferase [Abiotrophia sp.]
MNIANKLTLLRMLMIPVFIFLLLNYSADQVVWLGTAIPVNQVWAAVVFALASFTDFLDGYLARKYQLVTSFGAFFDPMADKLLVMAALILLVQLGSVPGWVVFIILARELMVTGLRVLIAQSNGKVMAAAMPGKIKTTTQMLAIICFLLQDMGRSVWGFSLANLLLYVCLFFTIYSGLEYFYHARFVFSDGLK